MKQRSLLSTATSSLWLRSVLHHNFLCSLGSKKKKKSFRVYETMADIQYQAYFGKLFKDNQNTKKKKNLHTLFYTQLCHNANKIADEMHRN